MPANQVLAAARGLKANHVVLVRLLIMERTRLHSSAPGYHQPHRPALSLFRATGLALANQAGAHNDGKNKRKLAMTQIHMPSLNELLLYRWS